MRIIFSFISILLFTSTGLSQEQFSSRKGSRIFPGHLHVVITVCDDSVRYELFNHWYVSSYAQLRDITYHNSENGIILESDTLSLRIDGNKVKLYDQRHKLNRKVKHTKYCYSPDLMRKISYAYTISRPYENLRHYQLYNDDDLDLSEKEFRNVVDARLVEKIK